MREDGGEVKVMVSGNIRQNHERKETTSAIIGDS